MRSRCSATGGGYDTSGSLPTTLERLARGRVPGFAAMKIFFAGLARSGPVAPASKCTRYRFDDYGSRSFLGETCSAQTDIRGHFAERHVLWVGGIGGEAGT